MKNKKPTDQERLNKIKSSRAYIRRKLDQGIKKILKSPRQKISFKEIVALHDSLNLKCLSTDD